MRLFVPNPHARKKRASHVAMAIALATVAVALTGVVAEPAYAQRDKKKDRKKDSEKAQYSKEFIEAFTPVQQVVNDEAGDINTIRANLPGLVALSVSPDEKNAAGGAIYNAGARSGDRSLQIQGMELMLASGKVAPENVGRFNFIAYQLTDAQGEYAKSRGYLQNAIDANFSTENVSVVDMRIAMAESFISENRLNEGLNYLSAAISDVKSAGGTVDEAWYRRGLSLGYNNQIQPQVYDFVTGWVLDYPSESNWRDAINIARNLNEFQAGQMLDLLRLSSRVGAMQEKYEYIDYVEAADARRLPREVKQIIENGYSTGRVSRDDIYIADALKIAEGRIASDRADLPALESDARAASAGLRTVMAAGDAFLSYNEFAKAEEFYTKALGMAGVDRDEAQTRRGIAQVEQGKFDAARASFGAVQGPRAAIARLWTAYVDSKDAPTAAPVATEVAQTGA